MVYCLKAALAFNTAARRDSVLNAIKNRLEGRPRWGVDEVFATPLKFGEHGLVTSLRFTSRADQINVDGRIKNFATGQRAPLPGSSLVLHDCTHDSGTNGCAVVARKDW